MKWNKKIGKRLLSLVMSVCIAMGVISVLPGTLGVNSEVKAADETGVHYVKYDDITTYRTPQKKAPTKEGFVFGGWFTEANDSNPIRKEDGEAYAKFVPEDVLSVKVQTSTKTTSVTNNTDKVMFRLVSTVDSLQYSEVGFYVTMSEEERKLGTTDVYKTIAISDGEKSIDIEEPTVFYSGHTENARFITHRLKGFTRETFTQKEVKAQPYWITMDGTEVRGVARDRMLLSDDRANDADGSQLAGAEDFTVASGTYQYNKDLVSNDSTGTSYKYFVGASDTVYLKTKYTTAGANNHFGITIRNGGETREVYFEGKGVKVLAGNSKTVSGLVDKASDYYNDCQLSQDEDVSVWAQRSATTLQTSTIATMLKPENAGKEYTVIWAIEKNVLYCSVNDHVVLRMPMEKLCEDWKAGRYYQLGVAAYNDESTTNQLKVKQEELKFGKEAKKELKPEEKNLDKYKMTYEPITGSYLVNNAPLNGGTGDFCVNRIAGTSGASADIKLSYDTAYAYVGVYVRLSGSNDAYQYLVTTQNQGNTAYDRKNYVGDTSSINFATLGISPFVNGTSEVKAMIKDGYLDIYYNGGQAYHVDLGTLFTSYDKDNSVIELGFACSGMSAGLAYFQNVKSMTEGEIQQMAETEMRFSTENLSNVSRVDYANGTIVNKGSQASATQVNFKGESDTWEVTGTMYVDPNNKTEVMQPQFFVTNGTKTFSPCLRSQGPRIVYGEWNYTSGNNSNSENGALTFNKNKTLTEKFANTNAASRTKFEMDFKVVIANDVMYVWFESDTEQGKLLPAWRLPLTTPIYGTDGTTELFKGFTSSDTPLKYTFGLGNTASCPLGGYNNLTVKTGDAVDVACISDYSEFLIKNSSANYDVTNLGDGTVTRIGDSEATLELFAPVGANDDVYVEAVLKEETGFNTSEYRVGFKFGDVTLEVVNRGGMFFSVYTPGWSAGGTSVALTAAQKEALIGNGLKIRAARVGGIFYMYVENNGVMEEVAKVSVTNDTYKNQTFDIMLKTKGAPGAVYSNLKWEKGSNTKTEDEKRDSSSFTEKITTQKDKWTNEVTNGQTTVFIGDSFFDYKWFFKPEIFDPLYEGKDVSCLGVSSSTTYDWVNFANDWLDGKQPKNLVVNIGTNNIFDDSDLTMETVKGLQELFTLLKTKMPNTEIYWFSIAHRNTAKYADRVTDVNQIMQAWCSANGIVYIETPLVDPASQTIDGIHPTEACYELYKSALENAGCEIEDSRN